MKIQIKNISFEVNPDQNKISWDFINTGKWEQETFNILDHFIYKNDIVIDIGAWAGPISLYAAHLAKKVYAIEPDPVIFSELENNVSANPDLISKIKCCGFAVASKNEELILYARKQYGYASSSLMPRIRDELSSQKVRGITLGKFMEDEKLDHIDFIKMDIEGGEFYLIPGMINDLEKAGLPVLYISFHYDLLTEHHFFLKKRSVLFSRIIMKIGKWFSIELFPKKNRNVILTAFQSLKNYRFIYTNTGKQISFTELVANPFIIKKNNLVFTNKKWPGR